MSFIDSDPPYMFRYLYNYYSTTADKCQGTLIIFGDEPEKGRRGKLWDSGADPIDDAVSGRETTFTVDCCMVRPGKSGEPLPDEIPCQPGKNKKVPPARLRTEPKNMDEWNHFFRNPAHDVGGICCGIQ